METKKLALISALTIGLLAAGSLNAVAIPQIPETYWGYALLNDQPAPIGTQITVEVYGTGEVVGSYTIEYGGVYSGIYAMDVMIDNPESIKDEGADDGEPLTWKLNGIACSTPAPGTDTAQSGGINHNFSLIASSAAITNVTNLTINLTTHRPGPPPAPESYWGYATVEGSPAAINTSITVEVYGTGEVVGTTTIANTNGLYSLDVYIRDINNPDDGYALNGDLLTWRINGIVCSIPAPGTDTAISGWTNDNFNITAPPASALFPEFNWILVSCVLALICIIGIAVVVIALKVQRIGK